ncbi:two-component system response regulator [Uliginosibacterium sp. H1]|uniref:two-component system response regulator n=1 Tax=Uliginosibacterium sp. H1 TaxID=3114757 RepID=UPI002E193E94|nr:EAL domain-containing protein [Uliginosibacterium sp. H1]
MNPRVMIVEDERIVALDLKISIERLGYDVVAIAANDVDALREAEKQQPDLILMDINLGGPVDGTEVARQIHDRWHTPVVFLTAYAEEANLARAEASAPYGYLLKPFDLRELSATMRMALVRHGVEQQVHRSEQRLEMAMDAARLGVWEWESAAPRGAAHEQSGHERFFASGHVESILGAQPQIYRGIPESFLGHVIEEDRREVEQALETRREVSATVRVLHDEPNGEQLLRWAELHARVFDEPAGARRVVGVIRDVTERRLHEEQLRQASVVFQTTAEGILVLDESRRIVSANPAFCRLTGYDIEEVRGLDPDTFLHARRHSDQFYPRLLETERGYWHGEIACLRKNDEVFPAWQHVCAVRDDHGAVSHYVVAISDISAIRQAEAQINHLAYHDALTGLGNRHRFEECLELELERARRGGQRLALLYIDLDGFKLINDTLGHASGDQLLKAVANRIRGHLRRGDVAIRLGGDEFVVIVPEVAREQDCAALAEKLLREVSAPVTLPREQVLVTASIGIALFPDNATDREELVKAADSAMYGAKARGRNRYAFYSPDMAARARERMNIEMGLRRALQDNQLQLYYQPVVNLANGELIGFEALIRWLHPELGLISPARFIPVAEESGLIEPIGEWVVEQACKTGAAWLAEGFPPVRMAVNVSVRQMAGDALVEHVARVIERTNFPARFLEIEITESTLQTIEHSQGLLYLLRSLGVSIAIDDFGTGFSSLGLLKHLPIDRIKIDRSFVRDLPDDQNDAAITRAIVAMAKSLGLLITAEGVETPAQRAFLRELGCEDAQGFLFAAPMPEREVRALLGNGSVRTSLN